MISARSGAPAGARRAGASWNRALIYAAGATALVLMALHVRHYVFCCDDAYIDFRYARNLALGRGLVFNPGEHVEGYTSLLWVVQLALGYVLGISGETFPLILSVAYTFATVALLLLLIRRQAAPQRDLVALIALMLLASHRNWAVWATSGLETRCFTFYALLAFYALAVADAAGARSRPRRLAVVGVCLALATLARPDAQVFVPLFLLFAVAKGGGRSRLSDAAALVLPFAAVVGGHYAWRLAYYGAWLPNTYYAKVGRPWPEMGWRYAAAFGLEYAYYLFIPLIAAGWHWLPAATRRLMWLMALCIAVHAGYYCYFVGGDHFEYRIFDFYVPLLAWMSAEAVVAIGARMPAVAVVGGTVALVYSLVIPTMAMLHPISKDGVVRELFSTGQYFNVTAATTPVAGWMPGMPTIIDATHALVSELNRHFVASRQEVHKAIAARFREGVALADGIADRHVLPPMVIASLNIGILGYFIDLPIVDIHGLTDPVAARSVVHSPWRFMAHERVAPWSYLEQRHATVEIVSATRRPLRPGEAVPLSWMAPPDRTNRLYSIRVADQLWLNIFSWDTDWIRENFTQTATDLVPHAAHASVAASAVSTTVAHSARNEGDRWLR